jgi:hypothetical protein
VHWVVILHQVDGLGLRIGLPEPVVEIDQFMPADAGPVQIMHPLSTTAYI